MYTTHAGRYQWQKMSVTRRHSRPQKADSSFRYCQSSVAFQRLMALVFANARQRSGLLVYMDAIITCSATWEAHLELMETIFRSLQATGLTLKLFKIHFGPKDRRKFTNWVTSCHTVIVSAKTVWKLSLTSKHQPLFKNLAPSWAPSISSISSIF